MTVIRAAVANFPAPTSAMRRLAGEHHEDEPALEVEAHLQLMTH